MELLDPHSYIEDGRPFLWLELLLYDLYDDDDERTFAKVPDTP